MSSPGSPSSQALLAPSSSIISSSPSFFFLASNIKVRQNRSCSLAHRFLSFSTILFFTFRFPRFRPRRFAFSLLGTALITRYAMHLLQISLLAAALLGFAAADAGQCGAKAQMSCAPGLNPCCSRKCATSSSSFPKPRSREACKACQRDLKAPSKQSS